MKYLKKYLSIILIMIVTSVFSQNNEKTLATTDYYTRVAGSYTNTTNVWSLTGYAGAACACAPPCSVPANTIIHINKVITCDCSALNIGANSTFIIDAGGSFSLLGNASITGSGSLTVSSGASLTVTGNLTLSGGGDATVNGVVSVSGTLSIGGPGSDICGTGSIKAGAMSGSANCAGTPFGGSLSVLPIELIDFYGTCLSNGVQLNWNTASELNNDYFLIEKSSNGIDWKLTTKIGGNGTSNSMHAYIYTDNSVNSTELNYYRMSQVDFDGKKTVFKMIDVNCNYTIPDRMILYPNPASTELNIHIDVKEQSANSIIKLINNIGQIVMETKVDLIKGINSFNFLVDFESGTYTILFTSDNIIIPSQKLLVIRN